MQYDVFNLHFVLYIKSGENNCFSIKFKQPIANVFPSHTSAFFILKLYYVFFVLSQNWLRVKLYRNMNHRVKFKIRIFNCGKLFLYDNYVQTLSPQVNSTMQSGKIRRIWSNIYSIIIIIDPSNTGKKFSDRKRWR